jgi:EpsI family protein
MNAGKARLWTVLTVAVLALSAWASNSSLFRQVVHSETDLARNIPATLGDWREVDESPASASEIRGLETRDIIKRRYSNGSQVMELVVAYIAQSNRKSAHAQEACLRGSGALVGSVTRRNLKNLPVYATVISIDNGNNRSWVYYWYKIGTTYTSDYLKSSLMMFMGGLVGKKTHGASLVRLLTPTEKGEPEALVQERIEDFTRVLLPELEKTLP